VKTSTFRIVAIAVIALLAGIIGGYFLGRKSLLLEWQDPLAAVTPAQATAASAVATADPVPPVGTPILKALPVRKARAVNAEYTKSDMVIPSVVSFGNGTEGSELHVVVENKTGCNIVALRGVAYGFHATGRPEVVNAGGAYFVQFEAKGTSIPAHGHEVVNQPLRNVAGPASLGVGHIDFYQCEDGKTWQRGAKG
jgi:hypothetical protein